RGVTYNGNTLSNNSAPITGQFLTAPGIYFLAETTVSATAQSAGGNIFELAPSDVEHAPNGPGAAGTLTGFTFASGSNFGGNYVITLTGAQAAPAAVPEPTTMAVLGLGLAAIVRRRRKSA
ncbi:PEP-CTERM sorting domain-containing protein, partial [bacterium]